jgi:hypothetical protein
MAFELPLALLNVIEIFWVVGDPRRRQANVTRSQRVTKRVKRRAREARNIAMTVGGLCV